MDKRLEKEFYNRNAVIVAKELLGNLFITNFNNQKVIGKIVETEAYSGVDDLACHASKGRTQRTEIMFGEAGHLYVYLNYGIFYLTNIVCDSKNFPGAVLIRSVEITDGKDISIKRILGSKFVKVNEKLATGPGKFSIAFGLSKESNGLDITNSKDVYIEQSLDKNFDIIETERVGIDYAKHCKSYLWRFYIKDNPFVSKK